MAITPSRDATRISDDGVAITPADSDLARSVKGFYVGGAGNVAVVTASGTALTFTAVPAGTIIPLVCRRISSTSTTATAIIGFY